MLTQPWSLGTLVRSEGTFFRVWAPAASKIELVCEPEGKRLPLEAVGEGYFERLVPDLNTGALYRYSIDGREPLPDPASRFQPHGVHGASQVVDPACYAWHDEDWTSPPHQDLVFYELHVGTFSPMGTFDGVRQKLPYLRDLGVTAVELMPIAEFPGRWNWGYDPAALYAPAHPYGTPDDLRALVDAAHQAGLAVFLDVVYNHFGPDGSYATVFGNFFSEKHCSPWGQGVNLDDKQAEAVRGFFIDNALHWLREYHIDGLRLDATHALQDDSDVHFLAELVSRVEGLGGRKRYLVAEDERNLSRLVRPRAEDGYGLDAVWSDDFHHQIRNLTAGDEEGYFMDFAQTTTSDLAATLRQGWFYTGQRSAYQDAPRGTDTGGVPLDRFVVCIQNHDQVGNRALGDRLHHSVPLPLYRAVSALLLFAPELPLLFMGQEWAADTPFQFFTDHHEELGRLITAGRRKEFARFVGFQGEVPDPQDSATFNRSRLNWDELTRPRQSGILKLYQDLLKIRRVVTGDAEVIVHGDRTLSVHRGYHRLLVALAADQWIPFPAGARVVFHTEQPEYAADGRPPMREGGQVIFPQAAALICTTCESAP